MSEEHTHQQQDDKGKKPVRVAVIFMAGIILLAWYWFFFMQG